MTTIWFNAWLYQSNKQTWAGLAEAIIRGLSDRLGPVEREKFLLRLHLSRINADTVRHRFYDAAFQRFVTYLRKGLSWAIGVVAIATGTVIFLAGEWLGLPARGLDLALIGSVVTGLATALIGYGTALLKAKAEPARINLSDFVDVPDYNAELGFVHQVTQDLRNALDILPKIKDEDGQEHPAPLVLFIDDLDRCSPAKVAEVFEAINLFIGGEFPNFFIILGIDTEIVAAALEEAHKNVVKHLPTYSRRTAVGWRFMDKFVQLPFVIPPLEPEAVGKYARHLSVAESRAVRRDQHRAAQFDRATVAETITQSTSKGLSDEKIAETVAQTLAEKGKLESQDERKHIASEMLESYKRRKFIGDQAERQRHDSRDIEELLEQATEDFSNNPRELKRLVNVYRFYANLRLAREARGLPVPAIDQLRNWVKLSLAWPEVVRWVRRSRTEWETHADKTKGDTGVGQRLKTLEDLAKEPVRTTVNSEGSTETFDPGMADWIEGLSRLTGLQPADAPWLEEERLLRFFRDIATGPDSARLSAGAGKGFW